MDDSGNSTDYVCTYSNPIVSCTVDGTPESIPAGSTKIFYVNGDVGSISAVGDGLNGQMLQANNTFSINSNGQTAGNGVFVYNYGAPTIVWSDGSSEDSSDITTSQWFGDYKVPSLRLTNATNQAN